MCCAIVKASSQGVKCHLRIRWTITRHSTHVYRYTIRVTHTQKNFQCDVLGPVVDMRIRLHSRFKIIWVTGRPIAVPALGPDTLWARVRDFHTQEPERQWTLKTFPFD